MHLSNKISVFQSAIFGLIALILLVVDSASAQSVLDQSSKIEYRISEKNKDTVEAWSTAPSKKIWEKKLTVCNFSGGEIRREIIGRLELKYNELNVISEFGSMHHLDLKTGDVKPAGDFCIKKEQKVSLRKLEVEQKLRFETKRADIVVSYTSLLTKADDKLRAFLTTNAKNKKFIVSESEISSLYERLNNLSIDKDPQGWEEAYDLKHAYDSLRENILQLLEQGAAEIYDKQLKRNVSSITFAYWEWRGCGGTCGQKGRLCVLPDYSHVFFDQTDLFWD